MQTVPLAESNDDEIAALFDSALRYCSICGVARDWKRFLVFHRYRGVVWCHVAGLSNHHIGGVSSGEVIAWIGSVLPKQTVPSSKKEIKFDEKEKIAKGASKK